MEQIKYKRKDYMDNKCTHRQYYAQFVTPEIKQIVANQIGMDKIINSTDEHFNDIGLIHWDSIIMPYGTNSKLQQAEDYLTPAGKVCILKEAARQLLKR